MTWSDMTWLGWHGMALGNIMPQIDMAWLGWQYMAQDDVAWLGVAWHGVTWHGLG